MLFSFIIKYKNKTKEETFYCLLSYLINELEIIRLSCDGLAPADIAEKLHISVHTVNNHKQNIYAKMGVGSNAEMLRAASSLGLV